MRSCERIVDQRERSIPDIILYSKRKDNRIFRSIDISELHVPCASKWKLTHYLFCRLKNSDCKRNTRTRKFFEVAAIVTEFCFPSPSFSLSVLPTVFRLRFRIFKIILREEKPRLFPLFFFSFSLIGEFDGFIRGCLSSRRSLAGSKKN